MNPVHKTLQQPLTAQALIFDIDGTLILSDIPGTRMWQDWSEKHGLDAKAVLKAAAGKRTIDTVRQFCPPGASPEEEATALEKQEVTDLEGIAPIRGVVDFLNSLPRDRWAIGTSSGPEMALARLKYVGIMPPAKMITGLDVSAGKPDPEVFLKAAEALGFPSSQTIVFEDAVAGVEAARKAGAGVVLVTTSGDPALTGDSSLDGRRIDDYSGLTVEILKDGRLQLQSV